MAHNNIHHVVAWSDTGPNKQAKLMIMFEDWVNSNENWQSSSLLVRQRTIHSSKQVGGRRWFTWKQLADKYQSEEVANEIVAVKESDNKDQIRLHPELPDRKDLRLFLCYDESYETDVTDHVVESLFEVEDKSKDKKKGKKEKKGKKRSSSSQSDSESKSSSDSESSSSTQKSRVKNGKKTKKDNKKKKKSKKDKKNTERDAEKERKEREKEDKKREKEQKREIEKQMDKTRGDGRKDCHMCRRHYGVFRIFENACMAWIINYFEIDNFQHMQNCVVSSGRFTAFI